MRASGEQVDKRGCYLLVHIREETACRGHSRPRFICEFYMGMTECVFSCTAILYPLMDLSVCSGSLSVGSCNLFRVWMGGICSLGCYLFFFSSLRCGSGFCFGVEFLL